MWYLSAGTASFYICKSGRAWHAWDNLSSPSGYNSGEDLWWQWKKDPLLWVPTDNAAGINTLKWTKKSLKLHLDVEVEKGIFVISYKT